MTDSDDDFEVVPSDKLLPMVVFAPTLSKYKEELEHGESALKDFNRDLARYENCLVDKLDSYIAFEKCIGSEFTFIFVDDYVPGLDLYSVKAQTYLLDAHAVACASMYERIKKYITAGGYEYRDDGNSFKLHFVD